MGRLGLQAARLSFPGVGVHPLVGEGGSEDKKGLLLGRAWDSGAGAWPLVFGDESLGVWLQCPWCPSSSACTLVCGDDTWAL